MLYTKEEMNQKQKAFTIVELLIVIVVIGILAAITVVAYSGIQNRANETTIESDLSGAKKKLELAKVDLGRYPHITTEMPNGFKFTKRAYDPTQNNVYYCADKVNDRFSLGVRSRGMKGYILTSDALQEGVGVNGALTCGAIGKTWANDTTTAVIQGYDGPATTWHPTWSWTN